MRPSLAGMFLGAAATVSAAGSALAGTPSWSAPQTVTDSALPGEAGIDGQGNLTVTWRDGGDPGLILGAKRESGEASFSSPIVLARNASDVRTAVNEGGRAVLLAGQEPPCEREQVPANVPPQGCPSTLRLRVGTGIGRLEAPEYVTDDAFQTAMAQGDGGHVAVAWGTARSFDSGLGVAVRGPRGELFTQQLLEKRPPGRYDGAADIKIAVDREGNALVSWQREGSRYGADIWAAFRPAGGRFGRPDRLWSSAQEEFSSSSALPALDGVGGATVLFAARGLQSAVRGPGGRFAEARRVGPPGGPQALVANAGGDQFAVWGGDGPGSPIYAAARSEDGGFPFPARLPVSFPGVRVGLDSRGNVLAALLGDSADGQRLRAATFTRFGFVPLEVTPPLSSGSASPGEVAVNDAGAAAIVFSDAPPGFFGSGGIPLKVVTRAPDFAAPEVGVGVRPAPGGGLTVSLGCDEPCRSRAELGAPQLRGARAARARAPGRVLTLRRAGRGQLTLRPSSERRRRLRRAARHRGGRVQLRLATVDSFGNRSIVVRRISARLLR